MTNVDPPTTLSDASLLTATASGDRAAFGELVGRYIDLVHAVACRQVTDASAADDVTQAVFLVLRDRAGSVRATSLPVWLHRTTRYAAATANRAARRRRHWERAAAAARPEAIMPPVDSNPLLPLLDDAIGALPSKDRAVVIDRYLRGRDLPSVAAALGATPAATQKRLERAIRQLRAILVRRSSPGAASGVTASAIAVVLSASAPSPASAALVAAIRSDTFTTTATSVAKGALLMMLQKTIAITAAIALAVAGLVGGIGYGIARVQAGQGVGAAPAPAISVEHPHNAPAFIAKLKNGVQIELIGLCEAPSAGRPWWRPDGSPLVDRPYTGEGPRDAIAPDGADWVLREIAYRQTVPTGTSVTWDLDKWIGSVGYAHYDEKRSGALVTTLVGHVANVWDQPWTMRFQVAAGPWQAGLTADGRRGADQQIDGGRRSIGPVVGEGGDALVDVTLTDIDIGIRGGEGRAVAIDVGGREHLGVILRQHGSRSPQGRSVLLNTYKFANLSPAEVRSVQLQSRPYDQWVEFRRVSIHPAGATTVQVVTSDDQR